MDGVLKRLRLDSATGPNQIDEAVKRSIEGPLPARERSAIEKVCSASDGWTTPP